MEETLARELLQRMTALETEMRHMRENGLPACPAHTFVVENLQESHDKLDNRLAKLEVVAGKYASVVAAFSAIGVVMGFAAKFAWTKVTQ